MVVVVPSVLLAHTSLKSQASSVLDWNSDVLKTTKVHPGPSFPSSTCRKRRNNEEPQVRCATPYNNSDTETDTRTANYYPPSPPAVISTSQLAQGDNDFTLDTGVTGYSGTGTDILNV